MLTLKYQSDLGTIHALRAKEHWGSADTNTAPSGEIDSSIKVKMSKGNREFGIRPRFFTAYRDVTAGSGATAITKRLRTRIAVLTQANYNALSVEQEINYKNETWKVASKTPEDY